MSFPETGRATFEALYAAPTTESKATIGDLQEDEMGGRWRYCKAGANITNPIYGAGSYTQPVDVTPGATAVGAMSIVCVHATDTSHTLNEYANGTIIIGASSANRRFYHIKGNAASSSVTFTIDLYHSIRYEIAGTEWATIVPSPYADVRNMNAAAGYMSVVCFPLQPVTSGYYFWGKTRGPVFGVVYSTVPGAASNDRVITCAPADGAIRLGDEAWNAGVSTQHLGWLIPRTGGAYGGGDQTFMLQLE